MAVTHELPTFPEETPAKEPIKPVVIPSGKLKSILKIPPARFLLIGFLSFIIAVLFLITVASKREEPSEQLPEPTPAVEVPPFPLGVGRPSKYASDETLLRIEGGVSSLETELGTVDLREPTLTPPVLDLKVSFD